MNTDLTPLRNSLSDFFGSVVTQVRAAFAVGVVSEEDAREAERLIDPDFKGWLHCDPMVVGNPSSRYGDDAPGYITRNGLGSLEVGASKD